MANIVVNIADGVSDPEIRSGDIAIALNDEEIQWHQAQHYSALSGAGIGALRAIGSLADLYREETSEFKVERVSTTEANRTVINTHHSGVGDPDISLGISNETYHRTDNDKIFKKYNGSWAYEMDKVTLLNNIPNGNGDAVYLERDIPHALLYNNHAVFGTGGSEYYYAGQTFRSTIRLTNIWNNITTSDNSIIQTNHIYWYFGTEELKHYLCLPMLDFDDTIKADLTRSVIDNTDPENPITLKLRECYCDIDDLVNSYISPTLADIQDMNILVDIIESQADLDRNNIVLTKS